MTTRATVPSILAILVPLVLAGLQPAQAEETKKRAQTYVAAFGGITAPDNLGSITQGGVQVPSRGIEYGPIVGLKAGFIAPPYSTWMGFEVEGWWNENRVKAGGAGNAATTLGTVTVAFNGIVRYPGKFFQPYAGIGPSIVWAHSYQAGGSDTTVGLNLLAGIRLALTDHLTVFAEFKRNQSRLHFTNYQADYNMNALVGGIGWNF